MLLHNEEPAPVARRPLLLAANARILPGPRGQMVFERPGMPFIDDAAAHRNSGGMDGLLAAGDKRMPPGETLPGLQASVGTGWRQPIDFRDRLGRQADAIGDVSAAICIIRASTGVGVQQAARDIGPGDFAGIVIAQFMQAAAATTVAQ